MFKKILLIPLLLIAGAQMYAGVINSIAANVGNYAVTEYDVDKMHDFLTVSSGGRGETNFSAFQELLTIYSLNYIVDSDKRMVVPKGEVEKFIDNVTNITNTDDPAAMYRLKLYQEFPEQYKLQFRKNQIMRLLMYYRPELKQKSEEEVSEKESRDIYEKNKKMFLEPPELDIVAIVVQQPKNLSLDDLDAFEKAMNTIAEALKKNDDVSALLEKNKKMLNPEKYSGRTGLKSVMDILKDGVPEELIGISLTTNALPTPKGKLYINPGTVLGPETTKFRSSDKVFYFILKVISRKQVSISPFEKVRPMIDYQLKDKKMNEMIHQFITDKIRKGVIRVSIINPAYQNELDKYMSVETNKN